MESLQGDLTRVHIWVTGRVQGVGFRAFVQQCGMKYGLTGWVRNLGDDSVEMVAEGPRKKLEEFFENVKIGPRPSRVEQTRIEWEKAQGDFQNFRVRYGS